MNAVDYYMTLEKYDERYWRDVRFLEKIVHNFAKKYYGLETNISVEGNGRLGRALGRFILVGNVHFRKSKKIDMNKNFLQHATKHEIAQVIIHEAIHHILFELGQPYKDGHPHFEAELKKHGAASTRVLSPRMEREVYVCEKCENIVATRSRKSSTIEKRYKSSCCNAKIKHDGRRVVER